MKKIFGFIGFIWGFVGVSLILLHGITCVYPYVVTLDFSKMFWYHYLSLIISIIFLGYAEGYKGFQLSFSPRAAQRLKLVFKNPSFVNVVLSPLFCMGFFGISKKRMKITYILTITIIFLIIIIERISEPWRGIIDTGVLVGLSWGLLSFWFFCLKPID
tara:strand:+ start:302 stop:778 length:477 start_codon:yes stop_codon:yes gene_type:complete